MKEKNELYNKLCHELALYHLYERFCFEMEASEKIFGKSFPSLERLINDTRGNDVFSAGEYNDVYLKCKKGDNRKKVFNKYTSILNLEIKDIEKFSHF